MAEWIGAMGFFKRRDTDLSSVSDADRAALISRLEAERDEIDAKIEKLMRSYAKRTGDRSATRGAKKPGRSPKDYAYLTDKLLKK